MKHELRNSHYSNKGKKMLCPICSNDLGNNLHHDPHSHIVNNNVKSYGVEYVMHERYNTNVWDGNSYVLRFAGLVHLTFDRIEQLLLLK